MVRSYHMDQPVPPDVIDRIVRNGLRAPSAGFSPGWGFLALGGSAGRVSPDAFPRRAGQIVIALGSNVHIFARPHRRHELAWCFETVLGCGPVATVEHPGIEQPMLLVRFPGGGNLSIEFTDAAPDDDQPRLGAWLELRADEPAAVLDAALEAGLSRVEHPGHPYYFMAPGGQVFTIAPAS